MANIVNITTVNDGSKNLVVHVYLESDGSTGELADEVLIDPADYGLPSTSRLVIEHIAYNFSGFSSTIEFDTGLVEDKMIWVLGENSNSADFDRISGLKDRSGVDGTGKIQITTNGFLTAGDKGSILLHVRK